MIQLTNEDYAKLSYSLIGLVTFIVVSLPQVYSLTDKLSGLDLEIADCPTHVGHLAHTLVFFLLILAIMYAMSKYTNKLNGPSVGQMVKYSIYSALIFYLISNAELYALTSEIFTGTISGCPSISAVLAHSVVFGAALFGVMYLPEN